MGTGSLLSRLLEREVDVRPAIVDAHGAHAYADVVRRALTVAGWLRRQVPAAEAGLGGRRVALLLAPGPAFVSAFFGVLLAGGVVVVLSPLHPLPETTYFCEDTRAGAILIDAAHASLAAPLAARFPVHRIEDALDTPADSADREAIVAFARAMPVSTPALQLYTSGTTGRPKGAVLTHGNLGIQQELVGAAWGFSPRDTLLHALPLHHMHGLAIALLTALGAGATVRTMAFDAKAVWDAMADATVFMGVPAMYHRLFAAFDAEGAAGRERWTRAARGLRLATSGSAALPVSLAERWRAITGVIPLERFGMTEIGVGLTNPLEGARVAGSVGLPLPTVETRIVGDDGQDAETGELWIRGPSVFAGYHERPEETAKAFAPATPQRPGAPWFRTGDTVTRATSGPGAPFRILGRTSVDILKSGGYKLSALEIEEALREHGAVAEVAVVGLPDEAWGDRVVACVVVRPGEALTAEELRAFVRARLAPYKVPKEVRFVTELPKNALGKVVKPALVRLLTEAARPPATAEPT
jgi:malonyl-CoA/methylmalonyl-CoA synthetase